MPRIPAIFPLLALLTLPLAACAVPRPAATAGPPATLVAVPTPLRGDALVPPARLLLTPPDVGSFRVDGTPGTPLHPGPGLVSATARFVSGGGAQQLRLYDRLSVFGYSGEATNEFKQERGDIGRSSTNLPENGPALGQQWQVYTVDSGTGASASSSVGVLVVERNYLINLVLSGPHGAVHLSDLLPYAQRQVAKVATAHM